MLAVKTGHIEGFMHLLPLTRSLNYKAEELKLLLQLLPLHIKNPSVSVLQLHEEEQRVRNLILSFLNCLNSVEATKEMTEMVESFFDLLPHPNPEIRVVQRVDWLNKGDYSKSANKNDQFEVKREVYVAKAISYLGYQLVDNMIGLVDRINQLQVQANFEAGFNSIYDALLLAQEILNVSLLHKYIIHMTVI